MKNISKVLCLGFFATTYVGCSEDIMDRINENTNVTVDAPAKFVATDVMTSTAFSVVSGDLNLYSGIYIEHEIGSHNQFFQAEMRESPALASVVNNSWGSIYTTLNNAKNVVEKTSATSGVDAGNHVTRGIGRIMLAYNLGVLTDMFGDAPWKEACNWQEFMTPKIDKQEVIYADLMSNLDEAVKDLEMTDASSIGDQDLIYSGNDALWTKAAYALKARYTMRQINKSADVEGDMTKILDYVSKSFTNAEEQLSYAMYGIGLNVNPHFGVFWSRTGEVASKSLFEKLVARQDPRIRRSYFDYGNGRILESSTDASVNFADNGEVVQSQGAYTLSLSVAAETSPTHLLSFHELLYLKAEALCHLNRVEEAKEALKEAVKASIENSELVAKNAMASPTWTQYGYFHNPTAPITADEIDTYFAEQVAPLFDAEPLKEVMIQKYIAFWNANGESTEAYNDVRRMMALGHDFYDFKNDKKFPLRFPYGNDDTTANPHVKAAYGDGQYVYTENVWWAGGTR